jgi:hypothetical protein
MTRHFVVFVRDFAHRVDSFETKGVRCSQSRSKSHSSSARRSSPRDLGALRDAFPLQPGQSGALLCLDGRVWLDYLSRPEAFARLYPKLLEGYLLDALEHVDGKTTGDPETFVSALAEAPRSRGPSAGLGEDVRVRGDGIVGWGLELDGELVQLCTFSGGNEGSRTRIARPSVRR